LDVVNLETGFVPVTADPASFTRRWNIPETGTYEANGPAIDNGKVFLTRGSRFGAWKVMAISEDTGETAWSVDMGTLHEVNPPAAANGKVYVTSTGHQDTFFWVFDQATGALVSKVAMNSQWEKYLAPTVFGDAVYTNSGYYGGLSKFNAQSNALAWFTPLPQYDGWTPAVDGTYAYAYLAGELHAVKVTDGSVAFKIRNPDYSWHGYTGAAVVLGNKMGYVVDGGRLVGFDLANGTVAWSSNSSAMGQPALAGDTVYVIGSSGSSVEARATATGMLEWKSIPFAANGEFFENLVVTNNLAFASSPRQTVAIDLNTHAVVWTYPLGGQLSISARGVLYIASPTSKLAAVNLQ
jgi:outer membrane protein assembly factor BamB